MDVNLYLKFFINAFPITSYRANNATFVRLISLLSLTFSMAFLSWSHYGDQRVCLMKILKVERNKQSMVTTHTTENMNTVTLHECFVDKNLYVFHNAMEEEKRKKAKILSRLS